VKRSVKSSKTEFGPQNQFGRVILSIGNVIWIEKKYTFGSQRQGPSITNKNDDFLVKGKNKC
jgi:hypothetical protein